LNKIKIIWVYFNNFDEIRANWDYFIQNLVKLNMFPEIGKISVNSNRLNQLWPNNSSSIQIRAKWNFFIHFWVTSNSFIHFWGTSDSFFNFWETSNSFIL